LVTKECNMATKVNNYKKKCKIINNQLEICAMMRSGQHGIINWIIQQVEEPVYFHNDILCFSGKKAFEDRGEWHNAKGKKPIEIFPWYIYNMEDISIENIKNIKAKYKKTLYIVPPRKENTILILRDPFNLFSSRLRFFHRSNTLRKEVGKKNLSFSHKTNENSDISWFDKGAVKRWSEYAKEYLGKTNYLGNDKVLINYNLWFKDKKYRKNIINNLGLKFSDRGLNKVPGNGYGSSFDVMTKDGKAQEMNVLNRWMWFMCAKQFKDIFKNKEMLDLSSEIYPELTKKVIKELGL